MTKRGVQRVTPQLEKERKKVIAALATPLASKLTPLERHVLTGYYVKGQGISVVAASLGIDKGSAQASWSRGLWKLDVRDSYGRVDRTALSDLWPEVRERLLSRQLVAIEEDVAPIVESVVQHILLKEREGTPPSWNDVHFLAWAWHVAQQKKEGL